MTIERALGSLCVLFLLGCSGNGVPGGFGGASGAARERTGSAEAAASTLASVLTYHNDAARTGQNLNETALTWQNVNPSQFGRLFTLSVDDSVYAQPLVVPGVTIGGAVHNALYVATENNSIYAFDADTGAQLTTHPWNFGTPIPAGDVLPDTCRNIAPNIGITGTPVIDASSGTIYFVTSTKTSGAYAQSLNAVDIVTGAHKFGSPRAISASVTGSGPEGTSGAIRFDPTRELQRAGLLLQNGVVYVAWGSYCDDAVHLPEEWFHGWVMGFAAQNLAAAPLVLNTTPNADTSYPPCNTQCGTACIPGNSSCCPTSSNCTPTCVANPYGGAIWQGGGGLASDGSFLYANTGNGFFDPAAGSYGDSTLALGLSNLSVSSWFTPFDQVLLDTQDWDLGAGGVVLVDGLNVPGHPHLLVTTGKSGTIYLLDRTALGSPQGPLASPPTVDTYCNGGIGTDQVVAEDRCAVGLPGLKNRQNSFFGVPAYFYDGAVGHLYFGGNGDHLKAFTVSSSSQPLSVTPTQSTDQNLYPYPGVVPSVSANGTAAGAPTNPIVWAVRRQGSSVPSALLAYRGDSLAVLYDSSTGPLSDGPGAPVQFTTPTIANGKVFVGGKQTVTVYGLSPHPACTSATCPTGCCKNGVCTTSSTTTCGSNGVACIACGPNETCSGGVCQPMACGPSSPCAVGCCNFGTCVTSTECSCGVNGSACTYCPTDYSCVGGACKPPAYEGWLDVADCTRAAGWAFDANRPNTPILVVVTVDSTTVAALSADGFRPDLPPAGIGNGYHAFSWPGAADYMDGKQHTIYVKYADTNTNLSGSPKTITCVNPNCNSSNCPNGCCKNSVCTTPSTSACGIDGATCLECPVGAVCTNGACTGTTTCGPSTCPNGCCQNGVCTTPSVGACGTNGATCGACLAGFTCTNGTCQSTCNASTCPNGCCQNGNCVTPSASACGSGGAICKPCPGGYSCTNGACQAPLYCSASTCPTGCCLNGVCTTPSNSACGANGSACQACAAGSTCTNGTCTAGCTGVCTPGATQTVACGNCGTQTNTCNSSCQWTQGTCTGQGTCTPGNVASCCTGCSSGCGCQGSMTCLSNCTWGSCSGSICKPGLCR